MVTFQVEIIGGDAVSAHLQTVSKQINQDVLAAIQEGGMLLKEEIENSIEGNRAEPRSVDTGAFLKSIESDNISDGVIVKSTVPHSVFLEFGTSRINERRHFRNSLDRITPIIVEKVTTTVKKAVD